MNAEKFKTDFVIDVLKKYFAGNDGRLGIESAFLFGSLAEGYPRKDSDIDVGVVFQEDALDDETVFSRINDIALDLTGKLGIDTDVVPVHKDFRKPMLYYNIIVKGKLVYTKDSDKYIRIKNEALFQMEDFGLFGEKWQQSLSRRLLKELSNV